MRVELIHIPIATGHQNEVKLPVMGIGHHHGHSHGHSHGSGDGHEHGPETSAGIPKALIQAIVVTLAFMVVELIGGYYANSLALISDGVHMLTDAAAMGFSLFVYWVSRKPATPAMSFGYHRVEILGALASGLMIWLLAGFLVFEAFQRLSDPPAVKGPVVFVIALIGLAANLASMKALHKTQKENINVRAAYLHLISDCLGSVGAVISGAVLWFTDWRLIDPIITILVSLLMLYSSWQLLKDAVNILMESSPTHLDPTAISTELEKIPGVTEVHDLHIWSVSSGRLALSVHLIALESEKVLGLAREILKNQFAIAHTTIQIEHPEKFDTENCYDCGNS
ncbi:MAG: cation transporter [Methylotenera sp.]|nr:cation transporter [Oligoflexia bacterium]